MRIKTVAIKIFGLGEPKKCVFLLPPWFTGTHAVTADQKIYIFEEGARKDRAQHA